MPDSCGVAVMAKASKAGLTKTRLAPSVGAERAADLNTAFLRDAADNILQVAETAPIHGYMAYGPPGDGGFFDFLPENFGLVEAWQADFGGTLMQAFTGVMARGHACACLINADSPTLPPELLARAAAILLAGEADVVLGPSDDGGYYLIGARSLHLALFEGIAWSTAVVFEQTMEQAARNGLEVAVLPKWYDVDDGPSLATLRAELFDGIAFGLPGLAPGAARHTRALLTTMADQMVRS